MVKEEHWDKWICEDTLEAIAYSRSGVLMKRGVEPQAARLFAVMEIDKRRELARRYGAEEALLAKLEWDVWPCSSVVTMRLVLDNAPHDLSKKFIEGFSPLPKSADIEDLLS